MSLAGGALLLVLAGVATTGPCSRLLEHVRLPPQLLPPRHDPVHDSPSEAEWERWSTAQLSRGGGPAAVALLTTAGETRVRYRGGLPPPEHGLHGYKASLTTHRSYHMPLWDCVLGSWLVGFVQTLPSNRGAVGSYYQLDLLDVNQCDDTLAPLFSSPPLCDKQTTQCVKSEKGYKCVCLASYRPPLPPPSNSGSLDGLDLVDNYYHRCEPVCGVNGTSCSVSSGILLKAAFISVQTCCMLLTLAVSFVIFKRRKCKPVAHGMWTILEMLLFGILLLYSSMIPQLFEPSQTRCILERWVRELGFIICYGAIILKLYRILMEFRSRKAHRFVVRDKDLLKYLFGMVAVTVVYLSAWTATIFNFSTEGYSLVSIGHTSSGEYFHACKYLWWDSITHTGEIVMLLLGLQLGLAARNASMLFVELRYLLWAIAVEAIISLVYYIVLPTAWDSLHPSRLLIVTFIRSQLTNTLVLLLIFMPIILFNHKPVRDSRHHLTHEPSDAYKPDGVPSDIEVAEVNISEMNPEEIRAELKRLYTQLEILKNKTIRQNNPHISKRRGGRKVAHRRFSLQKKGSREKALQQKQKAQAKGQGIDVVDLGEQEVSRTPEDSVCSMEGPSVVDGPSVTYSELMAPTPHHLPVKQ